MTPVLPLIVLVIGTGALLLSLLPRAPYAAPTAIGAMAAAWLGVALLGLNLPAGAVISNWAPTALLPVGLYLEADSSAWLLAWGLVSVSLATLVTGLSRPGGRRLAARGAILLLTLVGLAALMSGNLVTLVMGWAGLDFIYFAILILLARGEGIQPQAVLHLTFSSLGTVFALGAVLLIGRQSPDLTWLAANASPGAVLLMTLAAVFRLGLFPLHLGLPVEANVRQGLGTLLRLIPAAVALQAVGRLAVVGVPEAVRPWLTAFGVAAALVGAVQLWNSDEPRQGLTFVVITQSGLALLSALWAGPQAVSAVTLTSLALVLGGGLVFLANGFDEQRPWLTALPGLGAAALAGAPLTVGFFGLQQLWASWLASGHWGLGLALAGTAVALILFTGGLLRVISWPGDPVEGGAIGLAGYGIGLGLLALLVILGGGLAGPASGLMGAPAAANPFGNVNGWGLGLLGVCLGAGAALWRFEALARTRTEAAAEGLAAVLRLAWLYRLAWGVIRVVDGVMSTLAGIWEGEGALLWAMVITLVLLLLVRP